MFSFLSHVQLYKLPDNLPVLDWSYMASLKALHFFAHHFTIREWSKLLILQQSAVALTMDMVKYDGSHSFSPAWFCVISLVK